MKTRMHFRRLAGLIAALSLMCSLAFATRGEEPKTTPADPPSTPAAPQNVAGPAPTKPGPSKPAERLREGTKLIDETGTFQSVGDRVSFIPGGDKDSYRVLENLALQRISAALDEGRGPRQWVVSGTITEFKGSNYLLVTKASINLQEGDSASAR
jgi:hypothetical protein